MGWLVTLGIITLLAIIPSIILGIMLKSLLLSLLGTFLTFLVVGFLVSVFALSFMFGLGVTEYQSVKRLFLKKLKYKKRPA